jgi:hypothetical protein
MLLERRQQGGITSAVKHPRRVPQADGAIVQATSDYPFL